MWLCKKSCNSVSNSARVAFKAPWSQQVPFSCLQWVWIRPVLLSRPNVSTLVLCRSYSDNTEGTMLVLLQNTEQMLQSSFISSERRKSPITFAKVLFSASEYARGDWRFRICELHSSEASVNADGDFAHWWTQYCYLIADTLCKTITSYMAYSVLELGRSLLLYAMHTLFLPEWKYKAWESKSCLCICK